MSEPHNHAQDTIGSDGHPSVVAPQTDAQQSGPGVAAAAAGAVTTTANVVAAAETSTGVLAWGKRQLEKIGIGGKSPADAATDVVEQASVAAPEEVVADKGAREKAMEQARKVGDKLREVPGTLRTRKDAFDDMGLGTKAAAVGGAGLAAEGAVGTVRNLRNKQFGRAAFAAARTALGVVTTVAAFKAQGQGQDIGTFAKSVLESRRGGRGASGQAM